MTAPDLALRVDVRNPGQFFACCGLLEIVARLDPGAVGSFDGDAFLLRSPAGGRIVFDRVLAGLLPDGEITLRPAEDAEALNDEPIAPQWAAAPLELRIDWWLQPNGQTNRFKTWAGQMKVTNIFGDLRDAWEKIFTPDADGPPFGWTIPLTGRFGFDPRASWNALDIGFSPNEQKISVETAPLVELLAAFGLQRFRPAETDNSFEYVAWTERSTPAIAAMRTAGAIASEGRRFTFRIDVRGKYKSFSHATEKRSRP